MFKKFFSLFAALTLSVGLWAETVSYLYPVYNEGGATKGIASWLTSSKDATPVTSTSSTWGAADQETWLVVSENVTISQRVTCNGDVHLILADDVTLNATQGITVSGEGNFLTIYAQSTGDQMGQLIADATGVDNAAGIGGGEFGNGSYITINGGEVTATGGLLAAGIGGGCGGSGSNITINGGIVEATGGTGGAGIGGGNMGGGSNITINGGDVTATGGSGAAGIGGGMMNYGSDITINGGTVEATGGNMSAGIGGGAWGASSNIFVATSLQVKADGNNPPTTVIAATRTATTDIANDLAGKQYVTIEPKPLPVSTTYLDENGEEQNISAWEVKDASEAVTWGTAGQTTWFVVNGTNVQLAKGATCAGDVRLILADGAKLTATGDDYAITPGIQVSGEGNSLTIYAQSTGDEMGQLEANSGDNAAGIGGGYEGSGSNITINSGKVTAKGGDLGAGIGGGNHGDGFNITINGGIVTATGGEQGAGIGGANEGACYNITINGGTVTATGGYDGAGIGGGIYSSGSNNIYISDAYVLKAGAAANPTDVIAHSSATDMASTLTQRYVKIEGLATPYTRTVTANSWGTVCLPYAATSFSGADFYKVNYYDASNPSDLKLYIEPVDNLVAGMPYIFQATAETVIINHSATAPEAVTADYEGSGLYGSFARKTIAYDAEHAYAAIAGGAVNVIASGQNVTIPACRAYLDMDEVPTVEQPHNAPLRCMGVPRQQPTDLETVHGSQCTMHDGKYIINGQFVIVKDGKKYNALGF